jgi:hypothetical protein
VLRGTYGLSDGWLTWQTRTVDIEVVLKSVGFIEEARIIVIIQRIVVADKREPYTKFSFILSKL